MKLHHFKVLGVCVLAALPTMVFAAPASEGLIETIDQEVVKMQDKVYPAFQFDMEVLAGVNYGVPMASNNYQQAGTYTLDTLNAYFNTQFSKYSDIYLELDLSGLDWQNNGSLDTRTYGDYPALGEFHAQMDVAQTLNEGSPWHWNTRLENAEEGVFSSNGSSNGFNDFSILDYEGDYDTQLDRHDNLNWDNRVGYDLGDVGRVGFEADTNLLSWFYGQNGDNPTGPTLTGDSDGDPGDPSATPPVPATSGTYSGIQDFNFIPQVALALYYENENKSLANSWATSGFSRAQLYYVSKGEYGSDSYAHHKGISQYADDGAIVPMGNGGNGVFMDAWIAGLEYDQTAEDDKIMTQFSGWVEDRVPYYDSYVTDTTGTSITPSQSNDGSWDYGHVNVVDAAGAYGVTFKNILQGLYLDVEGRDIIQTQGNGDFSSIGVFAVTAHQQITDMFAVGAAIGVPMVMSKGDDRYTGGTISDGMSFAADMNFEVYGELDFWVNKAKYQSVYLQFGYWLPMAFQSMSNSQRMSYADAIGYHSAASLAYNYVDSAHANETDAGVYFNVGLYL